MMNLRRGLFRLWLIGSLAFASAVVAYNAPTIVAGFSEIESARRPGESAIERLMRDGETRAQAREYAWALVYRTGAIAIVIPIAVFIGGIALGWALTGFRANRPSN
jgi:hypothetical protein